jgi:acyl carrier protein
MAAALSGTVFEVLRIELGRDGISGDDDFFDIGGYSLLIVRIVAILRVEHGIQLSARQFVDDSRIAAIVAACRPAA